MTGSPEASRRSSTKREIISAIALSILEFPLRDHVIKVTEHRFR